MATWYVDPSATGTGSGADFTNAFTTLSAANTAMTAGDTVYGRGTIVISANLIVKGGTFEQGAGETVIWQFSGASLVNGLDMDTPTTTASVHFVGGTIENTGASCAVRMKDTQGLDLTFTDVVFSTTGTGVPAFIYQVASAYGDITLNGCTSDGDLTHIGTNGFALIQGSGDLAIEDTSLSFDGSGRFLNIDKGVNEVGAITFDNMNNTYNAAMTSTQILIDGPIDSFTVVNSSLTNASAAASDELGIQMTNVTCGALLVQDNTFTSDATGTFFNITTADSTFASMLFDSNKVYSKSETSGALCNIYASCTSTTIPTFTDNQIYGAAWYDITKSSGDHGIGELSIPSLVKRNYVNGTGYGVVCKQTDAVTADWTAAGGGVYLNVFENICGANAIYSKGADQLIIAHNTINFESGFTALGTGIKIGGTSALYVSNDNVVVNNIISVYDQAAILGSDAPNLISSNNIINTTNVNPFVIGATDSTKAEWQALGLDLDDALYADPQLVERTTGSWLLDYNSPAIGTGSDISTVTELLHPLTDFSNDYILTIPWKYTKNIGAFATLNTLN